MEYKADRVSEQMDPSILNNFLLASAQSVAPQIGTSEIPLIQKIKKVLK